MKTKNWLILIGALLLSVGLWWFSGGLTARPATTANIPEKKDPAVAAPEKPNAGQRPQSPTPAAKPALPPGYQVMSVDDLIASPAGQARIEQFQAGFDATNSKALDFYGKVVDQNGTPVAGVKVKAGVGLILGFERSGGKDYYTETDAQGQFSFVGIHGAGVGFTLVKEGYAYDQRQPASSRPNDYVPDANNPTIFTMWKLKGAEPMIHWNLDRIGLAVDGTPREYSILMGKRVDNAGDIALSFVRTASSIVRGKPFDWVLTIQIPSGGLAEITGPYKNEAPAAGYKPTITINMPASAKNWTASFDHSYYFTAQDGKIYGYMTVSLNAYYQPPSTNFTLEVYANPSGSRNLEFDEAKQIKP